MSIPLPLQISLEKILGSKNFAGHKLAGDGSQRSYYRLHCSIDESLVVMVLENASDLEKLQKGIYPWLFLQSILNPLLYVPKVIATCKETGLIIMEDLGDDSFKDIANKSKEEELEDLFTKAFIHCGKFWQINPDKIENWPTPAFAGSFFLKELLFFKQHFLDNYAKMPLKDKEKRILEEEFFSLSHYLARRKYRLCHRDFHSRNLMFKREKLFVIDFQDARSGPIAYDLISLCFDSYLSLEQTQRLSIFSRAVKDLSILLEPEEREDLIQSWQACLLQRQLKALGSFAFLDLVQKKGPYLQNVPKALSTLENVGDIRWPFLSDLSALILQQLNNSNFEAGAL